MWGLPWAVVQRIIIDAPRYHYERADSEKKAEKSKPLNAETAQEIMRKLSGQG